MGIGTGIVLFAAGAILNWAVDIDLPYVTDDALGVILMLAGIVAVVAASLTNVHYPQTGIGTGALCLAAGAMVLWAVDVDLPYVTDDAFGAILILAGIIAFAATLVGYLRRRQAQTAQGRYYGQAYR